VYVRHLQLGSFRSWERVDIALGPGPTVFVGRNGEGKTNLVEAVGYLATMGSHRVSSDAPLVRHGDTQAVVRAALRRGDRELLVEIEINPGRANRVRVNRGPLPRPRELLGLVRTVLFAPEDLALVRGDPTERRRFLDELLVTRTPRLAGVRADYDRVLKQRNALLKSARLARGKAIETLDVWDGHLTDLGGQLLFARLQLIADLAPHMARSYADVAGVDAVVAGLGYSSTVPLAGTGVSLVAGTVLPTADELTAAMRERVAERRNDELDRGMTLVGPHRDDVVIHPGPGADDPQPLGRLVDSLISEQDWSEQTRVGAVFGRWSALVGPDIAEHCAPRSLSEGELLVVAESTAWATQLRLLAPSILGKLRAQVGGDVVTRLRVVGPTAPSWKKGPRSVRGRGPRDTYG
jgi:DNA replication and repair protein RecF